MIPGGVAGLSRDCVALCHQVTTLDRSKLKTRTGTLPPIILDKVGGALKAALNLD
ncbi:MAG: type II toxin-antitoxin system PemK/MazF family toxin [Acidobacteria bacterium]|nr:type II toxin-antitoxin system PemK/MazF family toxin [Acidobacteriota bacterium]